MSDFNSDFDLDDENDELSGFVGATQQAAPAVDLEHSITIKTSGGQTRYVPVPEGQVMTVVDVLSAAEIRFTTGSQVWLNGAQIGAETAVPTGSTLTLVVDSLKGGAR